MVQHMQLEDWLDDLCVRFIINLPQEDLSSVARICFQVEEAQWFYEDFIRPLDPTLPSMTLRTFCLRIFQHCPLLASFSVENHTKAFEEFLQYKTRVPVRGAILLNHAMDSVVLVKGWKKGANWSFPRGKINKDEDDLDCAVREVYEETGLDLSAAGLVPTDKKPKYIEISMREQQLRLYVFRDVPMDTNFQPRTRKEISKIQWYKLSELPTFRKKNAPNNQNEPANAQHNNKFYMVAPFLVPLKKWVIAQKKLDEKRAASSHYGYLQAQMSVDETHTEDDAWGPGRDGSRSQVPAIDTLDGATRELQRLLKMQPPTQGVQPPLPEHAQQPLEDKGSALLSILQASGQRSEAHSQMSATQVTQMPLDHLSAQQSQPPPNAHHQHNPHIGHPNMYQQQPPPFQIPPSQQPPMGYGYPGMTQLPQHLQTNSAPLVHPQPHAPQVQAGVFNAESFQDSSQSRFPQPQQQHNQVPPNAARQGPLSGQSMALLNAFKRDTSHQPTMTNLQPPPPEQQQQQQQQLHQQSLLQHLQQPSQQQRQTPQQAQQTQHQQSLLQHLQQPSQEQPQHQAQQPQGPQPGRTPTELSGSSVPPPTNNHRNTLLDMFKKPGESPVQSGAAAYSPQQQQQHAQRQEQARQMEHALQQREIIGRQQREEVARQQREAAQRQQEHAQQQEQAHQMEQARQQRDVIARQREEVSRQQREAAQRQQEQAQQQREYAQRQREQAEKQRLEAEQQRQHQPNIPLDKLSLQPRTSPQILPRGQPLPASFNGPPTSTPPADQKRQLLSLFGGNKPPASTSGSATVHEIAGTESPHAKSRVGSLASTAPGSQDPSRRGSETPMSPADESFLLGYLQSVTTNAKR